MIISTAQRPSSMPPLLMAMSTMGTEDMNTPRTGMRPQRKTSVQSRAAAFTPSICRQMAVSTVLTVEMKSWARKLPPTTLAKSAMLSAVSGVSSDKRDLDAAAEAGNERAQLAQQMLIYQVKKYIGGYAAAMGGLDCLVFCGGIGENDNGVRAGVCADMKFFGIEIDLEKNNIRGQDILEISLPESKTKVLVICTNEELMIARDTKEIVEAL